jgi:protein-disulfide isomerase
MYAFMKRRKFLVLSTLAAFGACIGALSIYRAVFDKKTVVIIGDGHPSIGFENAKIELVVFEDFLCHTCRYFSMEVFPAIQTTYVDRGIVKYVMVPLATSSHSKEIANAALAVYHQAPAVYFPYVHELFLLFAKGTLEFKDLVDAAAKFESIDLEEFESGVKTRRYDTELAHNYQMAKKAMKKSLRTPAVFINGHPMPDISFESISLQIEKDLKADRQ